jgi:hypothetical protein
MVSADCSRVIKDLFYGSGKFLNNHQKNVVQEGMSIP